MTTLVKSVNTSIVPSGSSTTIDNVDTYLKGRLRELMFLSKRGDPWAFVSCCSFIDMLSQHVLNCCGHGTNRTYVDFCQNYLIPVNAKYAAVDAAMHPYEIAHMLYVVLRCGAVHSFSMKANPQSGRYSDGKAAEYTVILGHRKNSPKGEDHHLEVVDVDMQDGNPAHKAVLVMAEDFVNDLKACVKNIIKKAKNDAAFCAQFIKTFDDNPPLGWLSFS